MAKKQKVSGSKGGKCVYFFGGDVAKPIGGHASRGARDEHQCDDEGPRAEHLDVKSAISGREIPPWDSYRLATPLGSEGRARAGETDNTGGVRPRLKGSS